LKSFIQRLSENELSYEAGMFGLSKLQQESVKIALGLEQRTAGFISKSRQREDYFY
jgi:hypothetical protein